MSAKITVELNEETALKLKRRAERFGISVSDAVRRIAAGERDIFLRKLVGATK